MALEGLQLGQYRLVRLLGSGGMGEVYLAEDARIGQQVAIKVSRTEATGYPDTGATKDAVRLFQREAKAIARLDHPRILPLFAYGEESVHGTSLTYIIMPYRPEGSFAGWLQQRSISGLLSARDVSYFINQAADALQYAHDNQIVHQDVKPSNFLIRSNKEDPHRPDLLLSDFGIARLSSATASVSQSVRGTPAYMAPEQWSGEPVYATDQYALAVLAYELLVGRPPFTGRQEQVMFQHFSVQPLSPSSLNPSLSKEVDAVILKALAKKAEDRFPSISVFARALQQATQNTGPSSGVNIPSRPTNGNLNATLAISNIEAVRGTQRNLTLPGGRRVTVNVPAGAYNGQVLQLESMGDPQYEGGPRGPLILTITIANAEAPPPPIFNPGFTSANKQTQPAASHRKPVYFNNTAYGSGAPGTNLATPYLVEKPPQRNNTSRLTIIALVALIILVIISGSIYFVISRTGTNPAGATATVQSNTTATNQANQATATAQVNTNATATIVARANATATFVAQNPDPYTPPGGTLALYNQLNINSVANWDDSAGANGACQYKDGAYHASTLKQNFFLYCTAFNTNFSNFAYEVQLSIIQGDCGGIIFRSNAPRFYFFRICQYGSYALYKYVSNSGNTSTTLAQNSSSAINSGVGQSNRIAVVANGGSITLYVNGQRVNSLTNSTYSQGQIGVVASDTGSALTEVAFSNVRVWTF
jgi:eukaryotic-like serine/threonine-protein kinase